MSRAPSPQGATPACQQVVPDGFRPPEGHDDFPAVLAGIAGARDKQFARLHAGKWLERQRLLAPFRIDAASRQLPRFGTLHGEHRGLHHFGDGYRIRRRLLLYPRQVLVARRGIDDEAKPGLVHEVDDEIVDDTAGLVEHGGVERLAGVFQLGDIIGEQVAQEFAHARAVQIDDGHVRDVENAGALAHRVVFVFLRTVVQRHVPATKIDDSGACGHVPVK